LAVTDLAAVMVTLHVVPDAESHPLHPLKTVSRSADTVRVTVVP
jgi:hypothetical protein